MKIRLLILGLLLMGLGLLAACGDSDDGSDSDADNDVVEPTPIPESTRTDLEVREELGFDTSYIPMTRGLIVKSDLEVLATNHFLQERTLYVMYVVRNASSREYRTVKAIVNLVDEEDLLLGTFNMVSSANNVLPGQVVALQSAFDAGPYVDYYDGLASLVLADDEPPLDGFTPYIDAEVSAEFDAASAKVTGLATNLGSEPLWNLVAHFVLYGDSDDEVLAVVPAAPVSGLDENRLWQPGVSINFESTVSAVPDDDLGAIQRAELLVVGYERDIELP